MISKIKDEMKLFLEGDKAHQVLHWSNWLVIPLGSVSGHLYKAFATTPNQVRTLGERTGDLALGILESVFILGYGVFAIEAIVRCAKASHKKIDQSANEILNRESETQPKPIPAVNENKEESTTPKQTNLGDNEKPTEGLQKEEPKQVPPTSAEQPTEDSQEEEPKPIPPTSAEQLIEGLQEEEPNPTLVLPESKEQTKEVLQPKTIEEALSFSDTFEELDFYADHFKENELMGFLNLIINNNSDSDNTANFIVDHYIVFKKNKNPEFKLSDDLNERYVSSIRKQLLYANETRAKQEKFDSEEKVNDFKILRIADIDKLLQIYRTVGDGSCAFHALLGTNQDGVYRCTDVKQKRKDFCDWLMGLHGTNLLPACISILLYNYFDFPSALPPDPDFKEALKSKYIKYKDNREGFVQDKEVFQAFLDHLEKVESYLDQTTLEAAAVFFKKKVFLCQYGWFNDSANVRVPTQPYNENALDVVYIWYDSNHFERANII